MLLWALGPIAWMLLTSIKPDTIVAALPPVWIFTPTFEHYIALFSSDEFQRYLVQHADRGVGDQPAGDGVRVHVGLLVHALPLPGLDCSCRCSIWWSGWCPASAWCCRST